MLPPFPGVAEVISMLFSQYWSKYLVQYEDSVALLNILELVGDQNDTVLT